MFKLDLQSRLPIYEQLKKNICEQVMLGILKPDDQLPSVRSFARDLGINPNTVQKAYQELEREGIIYSVAGRGSYVHPDIGVSGLLQEQNLQAVFQAACNAKKCGIPEDRVIRTVHSVYKEEEA